MAYTDLKIVPALDSLAEDSTQATFTDATGESPTVSTGFSANGSGTATRPSYNQVNVFFIARRANADGTWTNYIPDTQSFTWEDPYWTLPLLDGEGSAYADADWQIVELVFPVATTWASLVELGLTFTELVELAQTDGAQGQLVLFSNITITNCRNNALMDMDDSEIEGGCPTPFFIRVNDWLISVSDYNQIINGATNAQTLDSTIESYYFKAAKIIDGLLRVCADPECACNC